MADLNRIISATEAEPTIVNPESTFVVVTYWWGRGNLNSNTARPCISFYEDLFTPFLISNAHFETRLINNSS